MVFLWQGKKERKKNINTQTTTPNPLVERLKHSERAQEKRTRKEKYFVEATYWRQQAKVSGNDVQVLALACNNSRPLVWRSPPVDAYRNRAVIYKQPQKLLSSRTHLSLWIVIHHKATPFLVMCKRARRGSESKKKTCWRLQTLVSRFDFSCFCLKRKCTT